LDAICEGEATSDRGKINRDITDVAINPFEPNKGLLWILVAVIALPAAIAIGVLAYCSSHPFLGGP
jgi:hypothetical protein